ncbi:unnamed protein product [Cladocopium goreaui]|uniref:Uncharacterized protein n=1 Tax=Cladocopium goreaui TaxID=2562237 RepID=A0A9P1G660_9DINO|nr:unnamed protein product [Cladocopium goreaui]
MYMDLSSLVRGFAHLGLSPLASELGSSGFSPPARSVAQLGTSSSAFGAMSLELSPSVVDAAFLGSSVFLRSSACFDSLLLTLNVANMGSIWALKLAEDWPFKIQSGFPSSRCSSCPASSIFVSGLMRLGVSILAPDLGHSDLPPFLHGSSRLDLSPSAVGPATLGASLPMRQFLTGKVTFDLAILVLDVATFDFPTSLKGALRMELVLSAFDHSCSGFFLFPRSMLHLGSLTSVLGKCHLDPSSLLLDMVTFGSPLSLHNAICLESFSPVSELVTFDPSLFSRSVAHLDLSMFPLGSVWIGLPPSALGAAHLDLLVSVRGFACFAASFSVLSFSHCDLSLLPQNLACTDLLLAVLGGLRLASLLLAWDATTLDFLVFLRAMAYLELKLLVLDLSSLNFMLSIKTSSCLDLLLLLCRTLQLDFSISILGSAALDFSLLPQSLGHLGVLLMVFSSIFPGFSLPLRTLAHPELSFFAFSLCEVPGWMCCCWSWAMLHWMP